MTVKPKTIRRFEMNMPRFTAEASLSTLAEHYEAVADKAQYSKKQGVIPQRRIVSGGCIYECDWFHRCRLIGCYA
jgi:hypothetical protein